MSSRYSVGVLLTFFLLAALACGLPAPALPQVTIPTEAAATAAAVAQQAAAAAATAAAFAGEQGNVALATVVASNLDLDLTELQQKFSALQPDENGVLTVAITDNEVNRALGSQATVSQDNVTVEGLRVAFTGGDVVLTGNLTSPIQSTLTAEFRPEIIDGQLQFTLVSASLGRLPIPTSMLQSIESILNNAIGQLMTSLPGNFVLQSVLIGEGTLIVSARQL